MFKSRSEASTSLRGVFTSRSGFLQIYEMSPSFDPSYPAFQTLLPS
jgi:hypothetical protein